MGELIGGRDELMLSETETIRLGAGGFAIAPPETPHAFGVPERARFLNIHAPGMSFGTYLGQLVELRERGEAPDPAFLASFDIHLRPDSAGSSKTVNRPGEPGRGPSPD